MPDTEALTLALQNLTGMGISTRWNSEVVILSETVDKFFVALLFIVAFAYIEISFDISSSASLRFM